MARKKARGPLKGRSLVAIGLGLFIVVAVIVVWRRSVGVAGARDLRDLNRELSALRSERTTLENQLREATSRARIVAEAQRRLGMHVATESQSRSIADAVPPLDSTPP